MPVVVTGADTRLGALLVERLTGRGLDLRATVDDRAAVAPLVARGVKTAVSDLGDAERFGAVLEGAYTVVHLRGADVGADAVLAGVQDVLDAAEDSGVERIVTMAPLTAPDHPGVRALAGSAYDTVVLRVGVVLAPGGRPRLAARARVAPLWVGDLVEAFAAADRLREVRGHVEVDAVGAEEATGAELGRLLGAPARRFARRPPVLVGDLGRALGDVLGVRPRPLAEAVRLTLS